MARLVSLVSGVGLLVLVGCGERPREREIAEPVEIEGSMPAEASSAERFGIDHGAFAGTAEAPPTNAATSGAGGDVAASMAHGASGLTWQAPEGWRQAPERSMRIVTFHVGPDDTTECYVTSLSGDAGGARANIDRWCGQMGAKPLTSDQFGALELVRVLGVDAPVVEVQGGYQGMNGEQVADAELIGTVVPLDGRTLFVKLVGPRAVVAEERDAFLAFCKSLQPEQ
jgi:hypothetical protein